MASSFKLLAIISLIQISAEIFFRLYGFLKNVDWGTGFI